MLNNNGAVIENLSRRSMQGSRKRNLVAIVAIILTTFMIATVFSVGISSVKNMNVMTDRMNGTRANASASDISVDKVEQIRQLPGVKDVGLFYNVGTWKSAADSEIGMYLYALDTEAWEKLMAPAYCNIVGSYPTGEYEIMVSMNVLRQLGIDEPTIGQKMELAYQSKGYEFTDTFTLCGYYDSYITAQSWGMAYLSERYVQSHGLTLERDGTVLVRAADSWKDAVQEHLLALAAGSGSASDVPIGYNNISSEKLAEVAVIVMLALFVVLSGYLLIYNIMYISVARDIHFYGMLKTIGATSKQLRRLVYRQAMHLMLWGISIGVILSLIAAFVFLPTVMTWVIDGGNPAMPTEVSFSPVIYIGTILFSMLTVLISCRKPARLAGKVSPMEAIRYTGVAASPKRTERHSVSGGKLHKMAFRNVFRDKKRAFLVFASLFMGVITFLSANSFFGSLDLHNYIEKYYPWDFRYESIPPLSEEKFGNDFIAKVRSLDGITKMEVIRTAPCILAFDEVALEPLLRYEYTKFDPSACYADFIDYLAMLEENENYGARFFTLPDAYLSVFADTYGESVDMEAFRKGDLCILGYGDFSEMVGRSLKFTVAENGFSGSVKIGGVFRSYEDCNVGSFAHVTGSPSAIYVSEAFMEKAGVQALVSRLQFNVEDSLEESVRLSIEKLNATLPNNTVFFSTQHDKAEEFQSTILIYRVLSGAFSIGFILIGMINFFNVMATGIYSRRRELAMLESVGMTKKQTARMLTFEGAYYALITSLLILTIGSGVIGVLMKLTPMIADYAKVVYPFATIGIMILAIFAICLSVPPLVYRSVSKETVTQRLRAAE